MKISIVGPSYPFRGGISHYTTLLYRNLKKRHETKFYAFKRQYPQWLFPGRTDKDTSNEAIREEGVENILDSLNPVTWVQVFSKIRRDNPRLLIFPWWVAFWTPQFWTITTLIKKFTKIKILFICHNVIEHESSSFTRICTELVLRNGNHFIVHSTEDLKNLKKILPDANVKMNFHPTYDVFFSPSLTKKKARQLLSLNGNIIFFFGFVRPYKGLSYLIEAMPFILNHLDVTLLIVGEFWDGEEEYRKQIENLGIGNHIEIVNKYVPNEEVGIYFAASDLVVLPYVSATGSGIVQVAFSCNKPVVTTKVGSLSEVISHNKTGYLISPQDSEAIAGAVCAFFSEHREEEFVANIANEKELFSWERLVETIESFVEF